MDEQNKNTEQVEPIEIADVADVSDPTTMPRKITKRTIGIAVAAVAVVALVGVGVAWATAGQTQLETPVAANKEQATPVAEKAETKSLIKLTVKADGAVDGTTTKASVVARDNDNKEAIKETAVAVNKEAEIGELAEGKYQLHVTVAPINMDGSTYKLPDAAISFEVGKDGEAVAVSATLEKLAKEDMTKEQLEAVATTLETSGNTEAAQAARESAKTAPSVPGSDTAVSKPAPAPAPSEPGGGSGNSGGSADKPSGGGTTPTPAPTPTPTPTPDPAPKPDPTPSDPNAGKTQVWVADTEQRPVYEDQWVSNWVEEIDYANPTRVYYCSDCGIDLGGGNDFVSPGAPHFGHHTGSRAEYPKVSVDNGWYESVIVRYETVTLSTGHWEWR